MEKLLLAIPISQPKRHRAHVLPPEGLPTRRDPLRPQCRELPRRSLHRGRRQLLVMSLDPRCSVPAFDGVGCGLALTRRNKPFTSSGIASPSPKGDRADKSPSKDVDANKV